MIRYALICDQAHEFEGWFASSQDYDAQSEKGLVACPACGSPQVRKQIMSPSVAGTKTRGEASPNMRQMMMEAMGRVRQHVVENFDDVGDGFATEARAIHEGKAEERGIYGQATSDEVKSLIEDGVPVAPLPPEPQPAPTPPKKLN